jgi:hypothetical protein
LAAQALRCRGRQLAHHGGSIDPRLLERDTIGHHARDTTAPAGAFPPIFGERPTAIESSEERCQLVV